MRSSRAARTSKTLQTTRLSIAGHVAALFALIVVGFLPVAHAVSLNATPLSLHAASTATDAAAGQQVSVLEALAHLCSGTTLNGEEDERRAASTTLGPCIACAAPALTAVSTVEVTLNGSLYCAHTPFASRQWVAAPLDLLSRLQPRAPPTV